MKNLALYIHWPFCESKCPYCDFNSHVRERVDQESFLNAYLKEIDFYRDILKSRTITSIFFGGGTPSLMNPDSINQIIQKIKTDFKTSSNLEITAEANPSSSEIENFKNLKEAGVNRLSIGIQSFDEERLKFLGRKHDSTQAKQAIEIAAKTFDNFSFDLIYNLPGQTKEELEKSLNIAFSYGSPHMSLYQLTIERGTDFFKKFKDKKFFLPDEDISIELYEFVTENCANNGLERYEISNYAKNGYECSHNLSYWRSDEYLGIGAGAHSRVNIDDSRIAMFDIHNPENWLENVISSGQGTQERFSMETSQIADELIFMGLRTKYGMSIKKFKELTGYEFEEYYSTPLLQVFENEGLIIKDTNNIRLTNKGLLLHSGIVKKLSNNTCITKS